MSTTITVASAAPLAGRVEVSEYEGAIENGKLEGDKMTLVARRLK